jgi:hypothetical protein
MSIIENKNAILHHIRIRLYPNYLPKGKGTFIARTNNDASLSVEEVCAAMKDRGGFTGNFKVLTENVSQFFDEMAYQLCDGFAVNTGYFSIHPNIGGTFTSPNDVQDNKKHPISFRFRQSAKLRSLIEHIAVEIEGMAAVSGYIDEFLDHEENSVNSMYLPEDHFVLTGHKIKIAGDDPGCGMFFVPTDPQFRTTKVTSIVENSPTRIIGVIPETEGLANRIEIRTQYAGSGNTTLKAPRIITSSFTLERG